MSGERADERQREHREPDEGHVLPSVSACIPAGSKKEDASAENAAASCEPRIGSRCRVTTIAASNGPAMTAHRPEECAAPEEPAGAGEARAPPASRADEHAGDHRAEDEMIPGGERRQREERSGEHSVASPAAVVDNAEEVDDEERQPSH